MPLPWMCPVSTETTADSRRRTAAATCVVAVRGPPSAVYLNRGLKVLPNDARIGMSTTEGDTIQELFPCTTASVEETMALGEALAGRCPSGSVLALYGDLGTGKTSFVKGVARGLGILPTSVRSPTFTILSVYEEGDRPLYHFDAYRVQNPDEFVELGYEEYVYGGRAAERSGLTCIEWADRVESLLPPDALQLYLAHVAPSERRITLREPESHSADGS